MESRNFLFNLLFVFVNVLIFVYSQTIPECYSGEMRQKINTRFLEEHNQYRQMHGVPALQLDQQLIEDSTSWSKELINHGKIETSSIYDVGENLYGVYYSGQFEESLLQPTQAWYQGKEKYNGTFSPESGFFTQIIWKSTQKMGCGICKGSNMTAVTCRYVPPGNVVSEQQFKENVLLANAVGPQPVGQIRPVEGPMS